MFRLWMTTLQQTGLIMLLHMTVFMVYGTWCLNLGFLPKMYDNRTEQKIWHFCSFPHVHFWQICLIMRATTASVSCWVCFSWCIASSAEHWQTEVRELSKQMGFFPPQVVRKQASYISQQYQHRTATAHCSSLCMHQTAKATTTGFPNGSLFHDLEVNHTVHL